LCRRETLCWTRGWNERRNTASLDWRKVQQTVEQSKTESSGMTAAPLAACTLAAEERDCGLSGSYSDGSKRDRAGARTEDVAVRLKVRYSLSTKDRRHRKGGSEHQVDLYREF